MRDFILNAERFRDEYLAGLQRSFSGWGDEKTYEWVFDRAVGSLPPDHICVVEDGVLIGGSGISYRILRLPRVHSTVVVGIMTGSWIRPESRGSGIFSDLISLSRERVAALRGALLIAFVTHDNPSRIALERAGSAMVPTFYGSGVPQFPPTASVKSSFAESSRSLETLRVVNPEGYVCIEYPTTEAFSSQFIHRPHPVELLSFQSGEVLVESLPNADRVLHVATDTSWSSVMLEMANRSNILGRELLTFSSCHAVPMYIQAKGGYIACLIADRHALREATGVSSGGLGEGMLVDPASTAFLGPWFLQSGDRM